MTRIIELPWTKETISKYKSPNNLLKHADPKDTGKILVTFPNLNLVGYIAWDKDTITALEVAPEFRNQGIATKLIKESGCTQLTVSKTNLKAKKLYQDLGFTVIGENNRVIFMKKDK